MYATSERLSMNDLAFKLFRSLKMRRAGFNIKPVQITILSKFEISSPRSLDTEIFPLLQFLVPLNPFDCCLELH
jgi:hypothetical protein